jgi:hypothetical protein
MFAAKAGAAKVIGVSITMEMSNILPSCYTSLAQYILFNIKFK